MTKSIGQSGVWLGLVLILAGCGAMQSAKDAIRDMFVTQIKVLRLDLQARGELNPGDKGEPLSVVVRVYQLQRGESFSAATYEQILSADRNTLGEDLLARKDVVLLPGGAISMDEPMHKNTNRVGVVALYRDPPENSTWRVLLRKNNLDNDKPGRLEFSGSSIRLVSLPRPD